MMGGYHRHGCHLGVVFAHKGAGLQKIACTNPLVPAKMRMASRSVLGWAPFAVLWQRDVNLRDA